MCTHKEHIAQGRIQTSKPFWCPLPPQHEYKDNGCLTIDYRCIMYTFFFFFSKVIMWHKIHTEGRACSVISTPTHQNRPTTIFTQNSV